MLIKDIMRKDVQTIRPDATVREAAEIMSEHKVGSVVVISGGGKLVGILTERDIIYDVVATPLIPEKTKVEEIMTKEVISISPERTLEDAADLMVEKKIRKLPVIEGHKLVGIVTASDLITYEEKLIEKISELLIRTPVKRIGG